MSYALEDARRRKLARPLYIELRALGIELLGRNRGGAWTLEVRGLRSLSPTHADRLMERMRDHEQGLLWVLYGGWDEDLRAIQAESS